MLTIAMHMVEAKPVSIALLGALVSSYAFDLNASDALDFGARNAVAVSAMDVALTGMKWDTKLDDYIGTKYIEPADFVAGLIGGLVISVTTGVPRENLPFTVFVCGATAALAPKLAGVIVKTVTGSNVPDVTGTFQTLRH